MAEQLSFDLPVRQALGREDFFVSPANALAVAMVESPVPWPGGRLVLSGPAGAGKTHLTHVWAAETGARIVRAADLLDQDVPDLASGPVAVEDVPEIAAARAPQEALFHLYNLVLSEGHALLLTGRRDPALWQLGLPDLQSRMQSAQHVALDPPDDALLMAVLTKLFSDRQLAPKPDVISYLVTRMDRTFAAAGALVERLDRVAMAEGRTLTRALAAKLLERDPPAQDVEDTP
ncbi:DnaA ATPase domain-containing protein [Antarcticimicrobium luteum]|uniref:Chromosomal replication initiator DnaA n=1 Tax=Antarcticimicrobium luteum TaxID=2547397 RepID=A0A4R5UQ08_9RHOB|nr:DnaA/Hda family protein [Antarcticimicrobium luteum]TDK41043.1 chromosomal replication initiator DnaA [Antarcticimicrobium luteum]